MPRRGPACRIPAYDPAARLVADRDARHRPVPLALAARSHGELLARLDLDPRVHRSRDAITFPAPPPRRDRSRERRGGAHEERADRDQRRRHGTPTSSDARAVGTHARPPLARAVHPGTRQRREGEHRTLRVRLLEADRSLRGGSDGDQAALGEQRAGGLRGPLLPAASCAPGYGALRGPLPADLGRREQPAHARDHGPPCRRMVDRRRLFARGLRRQAEADPRIGGARGARPDGDRAGVHRHLSDRRGGGARGDPRGAARQGTRHALLGRADAPVRPRASARSRLARLSRHRPARALAREDRRDARRSRRAVDPRPRAARHTPGGGARGQGVLRCGAARAEDPRLRRHGGPRLRSEVCAEGARDRRRADAAGGDAALLTSLRARRQGDAAMAFGDSPEDAALRAAWGAFCDRLRAAGDRVFKDENPATPLQRADAFRFLTQNLGQAFDLALETKDTRYPVLHAFRTPLRKLGGDAADLTYRQAWIDGESEYRITGNTGTARFLNFTVQGPRPDRQPGTGFPSLHEPFGDVPEANLFKHEIETARDGSFELHVGGERR